MVNKLIIFDCDGTLVDSELICNKGLSIMLSRYGIDVSAIQLMEKYRGGQLKLIINDIKSEYQVDLPRSFVEDYRSHLSTLYVSELKSFDFVSEALSQLKYKLCVASNGPRDKVIKALKKCKLLQFFNEQSIFSAYDISKWKPDPDLFLHASKQFDITPDNCVVVEDSATGLQAASNAGMKSIYFNPHKRLIRCYYDYEISRMNEVLPVLEKIFSI